MKDMVIKTLDFLASLLVVLALIVGVIVALSGQGSYGFLIGVGLFVGACFTCGFWMALSKIIENQERMMVINKRLLQSIDNLDENLSSSMIKALSSRSVVDPVKCPVSEDVGLLWQQTLGSMETNC